MQKCAPANRRERVGVVHSGPQCTGLVRESTLVHSGLVKDGSFGFVTEPQLSGLSPTDALGKVEQCCALPEELLP